MSPIRARKGKKKKGVATLPVAREGKSGLHNQERSIPLNETRNGKKEEGETLRLAAACGGGEKKTHPWDPGGP